jgi:hydrogenase maturation protease
MRHIAYMITMDKIMEYQVLVLGIGNILRSDDGIGVYAARDLAHNLDLSGVLVLDVGTSILSCVEKMSRARNIIAIDAVCAGGEAGTVYRIDLDEYLTQVNLSSDAHGFSLVDAIKLSREITELPHSVILYGVEPANLCFGTALSSPVEMVLSSLVETVSLEIQRILRSQ